MNIRINHTEVHWDNSQNAEDMEQFFQEIEDMWKMMEVQEELYMCAWWMDVEDIVIAGVEQLQRLP